jgi:hypothetical protein
MTVPGGIVWPASFPKSGNTGSSCQFNGGRNAATRSRMGRAASRHGATADGEFVTDKLEGQADQDRPFGESAMRLAIHTSHSRFRAIQKIATMQVSSGFIEEIPVETPQLP